MEIIIINNPFLIKVEVIEIDDVLPSFKCNFEVSTNTIKYIDEIWIQCNEWDDYINQLFDLYNGTTNKATLLTMSRYVSFNVLKSEGIIYLLIDSNKPDNGFGSIELKIQKIIDLDTFSCIKNKFLEFVKWW